MVKLTKIYTKTGDDGSTGLVGRQRLSKDDPRVEAYGAVDEANSFIGLALAQGQVPARFTEVLRSIQNDLFDVGADLATPVKPGERSGEALRVTPEQVNRLERTIDEFNAVIPPLASFVLPGGTALAAALHVARVVTRRAERRTVSLWKAEPEGVNPESIRYLNRLSDLLFVLARAANEDGRLDVLWHPGASQG